MSLTELTRWYAYMNAVKFAAAQEKRLLSQKKKLKNFDLPWIKTVEYIDDVAGDLALSLKEKGGIPYKYSLDLSDEDATNTNEIEYNYE